MLDQESLKLWLQKDLTIRDKLLLVLSTMSKPCSVSNLNQRFSELGAKLPRKVQLSGHLFRLKGLAIRVPTGWEITDNGRMHLHNLGVSSVSPAAVQVAVDLRSHLARITVDTTRAFVEEAIKCYEAKLFRSAIVMSWIAAVDVLYREVVSNHLAAFNAESLRLNAKWRPAVDEDGLARMGEFDFLERLPPINVIGKSVKDELQVALKLRNGCGHPNSLKVGSSMTTRHLESLILNVFERFSV